MGRRGPKPEPASVKKAKGNSGHRPIGEDPAAAETAPAESKTETRAVVVPIVHPPKWLKKGGLLVWNRLAPRLIAMRLLSQIDAETFARYCRNFARWHDMQKRLDTEGEIYEIETASGTVRRYDPAFVIADRLERQLSAAEANFGLNPAERQRLFAARAAAAAQGAGLFDDHQSASKQEQSKAPTSPQQSPAPRSAIGYLQ